MYKSFSVALVSNEQVQCFTLHSQLSKMGSSSALFATATDFLSALTGGRRFDLLVLMLGKESRLDGLLYVCGVLGMPVLLVVQHSQWDCNQLSLNNDFLWDRVIAIPVSRTSDTELNQCVRTLLHGADIAMRDTRPDGMVWGDYRFADDGSPRVWRGVHDVHLQPLQFAFALMLFRNMGRVLTRDELWTSIWRCSPKVEVTRAIDVCAANLRRKLELRGESGFVLRGVYGRGYLLNAVRPFAPATTPGIPSLNALASRVGQHSTPVRHV